MVTGGEQLYNITGVEICSNIRIINNIIDELELLYPEYKREREGARVEYIEFIKDRKGHDFKYELSTKHNLEAVKHQQDFSMTDTIKYYVEKYKAS